MEATFGVKEKSEKENDEKLVSLSLLSKIFSSMNMSNKRNKTYNFNEAN